MYVNNVSFKLIEKITIGKCKKKKKKYKEKYSLYPKLAWTTKNIKCYILHAFMNLISIKKKKSKMHTKYVLGSK